MNIIANLIRINRINHNMSVFELSEKSGVSKGAIYTTEEGRHTPTYVNVTRILTALELDEALENINTIGKRLTMARRAKHIPRYIAAEKVFLTVCGIDYYEKRNKLPKEEIIILFAKIYGVSPEWLYLGDYAGEYIYMMKDYSKSIFE